MRSIIHLALCMAVCSKIFNAAQLENWKKNVVLYLQTVKLRKSKNVQEKKLLCFRIKKTILFVDFSVSYFLVFDAIMWVQKVRTTCAKWPTDSDSNNNNSFFQTIFSCVAMQVTRRYTELVPIYLFASERFTVKSQCWNEKRVSQCTKTYVR